ncbi:hypothetical protein [Saccharothrix variisporea]|uniref:Uncharacterized protein n=1 Tax=Saccharothrix variisporea TaxID=543527 RepID=A0A495XFG8_9PSEU|nr:hypothetical protein [Saccharothrix variisporea]RKT72762.1 hypothetical protein DFJ66_6086 [Saccharothrix variisporea]
MRPTLDREDDVDWQKIGAVAGVVSAALAVVGLFIALAAWLKPQSPSAEAPTTTSAATAAPAAATTTTTTKPGYVEVYRDKPLALPAGALGRRAFVDLDKPSVDSSGSPAVDRIEAAAEFSYDDDGRFTTVLTKNGAKLGFGTTATTPEQCLDAVDTQPMGRDEPVGTASRIEVGTRLCALTGNGNVGMLEVTELGPPEPWGGTVALKATLWKKSP